MEVPGCAIGTGGNGDSGLTGLLPKRHHQQTKLKQKNSDNLR
jgi:hypothetical protein